MADYRDYGQIMGPSGGGPSRQVATTLRKTQVYEATHKGDLYLPFMNRSFISFSFGGKNIEEFNLLAYFSNDRLAKDGYASFEDITTKYNILDGQLYWGTHYNTNSLEFSLTTDGLTQQLLDEFMRWFAPGLNRELILAEHPNRAIIARVNTVPKLELLPFEEKVTVPIGGYIYKTSTTKYKGDISISFIMDEPFWYSKVNIFGLLDERGVYHDTWIDANGNSRSVYDDPDALKIAYEDGIPISSMLAVSLLLGDNTFANLDSEENAIIAENAANITLTRDINDFSVQVDIYDQITEATETFKLYLVLGNTLSYAHLWRTIAFTQGTSYAVASNDDPDEVYQKLYDFSVANAPSEPYQTVRNNVQDVNPRSLIATLALSSNEYISGAKIAGPHMSSTTGIESLTTGQRGYFYYAGTAPSYPVLEFKMTPLMRNNVIIVPWNSFNGSDSDTYNSITIESTTKQSFDFTAPNIYISYNTAIKIFDEMESNTAWESVREKIRDNVNHYEVRKWAIRVIDSLDTGSGIGGSLKGNAKTRMSYMFKAKGSDDTFLSGTYSFDSKTGTATGRIYCRTINSNLALENDNAWWKESAGTVTLLTENVGDMVRSSYLVIRDRNYPDLNGNIMARTGAHPEYCHILSHNVPSGLSNIFIKYLNMYL